ncbi:Ser/Thr protein phosphatase Ppe1 [Mucor ambiguus]|uniref:protein-serine/threonine phosphatase n=1 Tax=Mucor ambiguus TaxID=91626 RepID=A0A0C9MCX1_9FUNG|nr:Ser/Thr protein phosphatase Ppe1 [Mucor ambiguus]
MNVDACIESIKECKYLPESDMRQLCYKLKEILAEESTVVPVNAPVTLCGDIHGQFYDLVKIFEVGGDLPNTSYIFMVTNTQTYIPIVLHLPEEITKAAMSLECMDSMANECLAKYQNSRVWEWCCTVFDYLPLAAVIDGSVFCVHGGLSPELPSIDSIRTLFRMQELPQSGGHCDLLWSDPETQVDAWAISPRGGGYLFGPLPTTAFCHNNGIDLIVRSHQLVDEGYNYPFDEGNLVTLWSAPNYCYRCGNKAAILKIPEEDRPIVSTDYTIFLENDIQGDTNSNGGAGQGPGSQYFL